MSNSSVFRNHLFHPLIVPVIALTAACGASPEGRDLFTVSGAITGIITHGNVPLQDATVIATGLFPPPNGALRLTDSTGTGVDGRYVLALTTLNEPDTVLSVTLSVRPPATTGLPRRDTANVAVRITHVLPPRDTAHVDIVY